MCCKRQPSSFIRKWPKERRIKEKGPSEKFVTIVTTKDDLEVTSGLFAHQTDIYGARVLNFIDKINYQKLKENLKKGWDVERIKSEFNKFDERLTTVFRLYRVS